MTSFNRARVVAVVMAVALLALAAVGFHYCSTSLARASTGLTGVFLAFVMLLLAIRGKHSSSD